MARRQWAWQFDLLGVVELSSLLRTLVWLQISLLRSFFEAAELLLLKLPAFFLTQRTNLLVFEEVFVAILVHKMAFLISFTSLLGLGADLVTDDGLPPHAEDEIVVV